MAAKEFTIYVLAKDKHSENLITYFYENMKEIKRRGFPKPSIYKVTKKELMKHKETLMNNGIRTIPSIKFNGSVYNHNEVYELLRTDLNALRKKAKKKDEDLEDYYNSTTRKYAEDQDYFGSIINRIGKEKYDGRTGYKSEEEKPLTEADIKNLTSGSKRGEDNVIKGNTYEDSESDNEPAPPSKTKKSKKSDSSYNNFDDLDAYYASLATSNDLGSD